eukprot:TRINITY_DN17514_c0_g1_i1.p1 TRINITY_DN17514_c0_g1~~TRINITY_DN17514_c0_g1_i1.p1  ORF type:complete len:263 (+),score=62.95 TRINITY_DN17514_c0_g1_i1:68-856(+)
MLRRTAARLSEDVSAQWPFGRPVARGTARQYIPYAKKTLEGVAAAMADRKQDPPILASLLQHLSFGGIGWRVARNHWNLDGEISTFATVTEVMGRRPPYEMMVTTGYMTVNGETTNCPIYLPQQHYSGWTALTPPEPEEVDTEFQDRTGFVVPFSNKVYVEGIDWTTPIEDVQKLMATCGKVVDCQWETMAFEKATKQAIVVYESLASAKQAYEELQDAALNGMQIIVSPGAGKVLRPPSIGTDVPVDYSFGRMPDTPSINW